MLTARTTETYGQVSETAFHIPFYGCVYQGIYVFEEDSDFSVLFEEADNGFVESGERLVTFVFTGVVHRTAVKYEAAAVAGRIFGNTFLVSKAGDLDYQTAFLQVVGELFQFGQFAQYFAEIRILGIGFLQ